MDHFLLLLIAAGGVVSVFLTRALRSRPTLASAREGAVRPQATTALHASTTRVAQFEQNAAEPVARRGFLGPLIFGAYVTFLVICAAAVLTDPPWAQQRRGYDGMIGFLASGAAGFPETLLILSMETRAGETGFHALCWIAAVVNCLLVGLICGIWGRRGKGAGEAKRLAPPVSAQRAGQDKAE